MERVNTMQSQMSSMKNHEKEQEQWLSCIIPAIWKVEIKRIKVQGHPRQNVRKAPSQQTSCAWWLTSVGSLL
jgi:hypothetical protein